MATPPPDTDHEELEHIPWAMLSAELGDGRSRTLAAVALALVVALVVGVVAVRARRTGPATVLVPEAAPALTAAPPRATTVAPTSTAPEPGAPVTAGLASPVSPSSPGPYSEADLMAVLPDGDRWLAAAEAEWFVADFFTVDGDVSSDGSGRPGTEDGEASSLGSGWPGPEVEQGAMAWVEWVRATRVEPAGPAAYTVTVAFRILLRTPDGHYRRAPRRRVTVPVAVSPQGAASVVDLPSPAVEPASPRPDPPPEAAVAVPPDVAERAVAEAVGFGAEPEVVGASGGDARWRVVVTVADAAGIRWPLVVHLAP